jgi:hypothetical protein
MLYALKSAASDAPIVIDILDLVDDDGFGRIRCPRCRWHPSASSRWFCQSGGTPEPPFDACGTAWNTFSTGGKCPGCGHQWTWTTCLRCHEVSLHEDWYEHEW